MSNTIKSKILQLLQDYTNSTGSEATEIHITSEDAFEFYTCESSLGKITMSSLAEEPVEKVFTTLFGLPVVHGAATTHVT